MCNPKVFLVNFSPRPPAQGHVGSSGEREPERQQRGCIPFRHIGFPILGLGQNESDWAHFWGLAGRVLTKNLWEAKFHIFVSS